MGLFDFLFGKRVTVHTNDDNGNEITRSVSENQIRQWEAEGKITRVEMIQVHMLNPMGNRVLRWQVGKDVPAEVVKQFRDAASGDLYAVTVYEAGKPRTSVLPKAKWLEVKAAMGG